MRCTVDEWKIDEIVLQVEAVNEPAKTLYETDGYKEVFRREDATALRLQPAEPSPFSNPPAPLSALAPENKKLLKETLNLGRRRVMKRGCRVSRSNT